MKASRITFITLFSIFAILFASAAQAALHIIIVDDGGEDNVGHYTSLAVVNGNPAISYVDDTNDNLKYVRATEESGTAWGAPLVIDESNVRGRNKLFIVDGYPAIAYFDSSKHELKFVRANDADGLTWGSSVTVDDSGSADWYLSAAVVNGKPAISYQDITNKNLMYVRATDKRGTIWGTQVVVDDTEDTGYEAAIAVVDGHPAISYYESTDDDVMYVRATDADGATWGTPLTIDKDGGGYISLSVVGGKPAAAYWDWTIDGLKYLSATDTKGTSWGTASVLDTDGRNVGLFASLTAVNGLPKIGYVENGSGHPELRYISGHDAAGTGWNTPIVVDPNDAGWHLSLAEVDGWPALSYWDSGNGVLKYVKVQIEQHAVYMPLVAK